jgi:hypothetical protein
MSQIAIYAGWYSDHACGPFALPKVEFMPGAFAYHIHSYSAQTLRSTTDNWCGPLLAKGATCTMGCVNEPYLVFTPNVALFLDRFIFGKFTFGEAAWAAQRALSWQTTVVGDPLYRPFGTSPAILGQELVQRQSPLIEWSYLRGANLQQLHGVPSPKVANYLENLQATTNSAVLMEKLGTFYTVENKPAAAVDAFERALNLNPSPEQRIGLRLLLGRELVVQNYLAAARRNYQKLLEEDPDYPGRDDIQKKIDAANFLLANTNGPAK